MQFPKLAPRALLLDAAIFRKTALESFSFANGGYIPYLTRLSEYNSGKIIWHLHPKHGLESDGKAVLRLIAGLRTASRFARLATEKAFSLSRPTIMQFLRSRRYRRLAVANVIVWRT